jgi:hypothetical protein
MKRYIWTMPEWMEKYKKFIPCEPDRIELLMNDANSNTFNNAPLALICVSVKSAVILLERLHEEGIID